MKTDEIYFPVSKQPLKDLIPGYATQTKYSHAIVGELETGPKILNFCSSKYELVPNEKIVRPFLDIITDKWETDIQISHSHNSRFYVDVILKKEGLSVGSNKKLDDTIFPKLRLCNSYDGSMKFQFNLGFYRLVCTNGMVAPVGDTTQIKMLHTPSIETLTNEAFLTELVGTFSENAELVTESYQSLAHSKISDIQQRVQEVLNNTKFPKRQEEAVIDRANIERESGIQSTDWLIYNAFNYQLNHNDVFEDMAIDKKTKIDHQVLNYLSI